MIAIGVGCRRGATAEAILALVRDATGRLDLGSAPAGFFTLADKRGEPGLAEAAGALEVPLFFLDRELLAAASAETRFFSRRVNERFGLPGIAETAALAGAGSGAVLLVPRLASLTVTCAIAGPVAMRTALLLRSQAD